MKIVKCEKCGKEFENHIGVSLPFCIDCIEKDFVPAKSGISVNCLICSEEAELTGEEARNGFYIKVCDKCKQAVMRMRDKNQKKKSNNTKNDCPNNICDMH